MRASSPAPNLVQAVRAHFGLGRAPLAGWLGVSEALLKQAATNRRDLPTAAYLRLRPLAEALPPTWAQPVALLPAVPAPGPLAGPLPHPTAPAALRARLATCRHLALGLARKLAPLATRQAQARHLLAVLPTLAAGPPAADAEAQRWLSVFEAQARERLGPAASAALALAQARRQALLVEAAQLAAWLGAAGEEAVA